jgi:hypothetical protein
VRGKVGDSVRLIYVIDCVHWSLVHMYMVRACYVPRITLSRSFTTLRFAI